MGATQSIRKLTIDNEEDVNVIQVSNAVVQRLAQRAKPAKTSEVRPSTLSEPQPNKAAPQPPQSSDMPVASGYPVYYYPQLTLTAIEIQQQKEKELYDQDQYWQNRIKNLEENHLKINKIIDEEYKKALGELHINGYEKKDMPDMVQPCLENTEKVLQCYKEHPKEILKCSSLVEEFSNCVDQRRAHVIAERCH